MRHPVRYILILISFVGIASPASGNSEGQYPYADVISVETEERDGGFIFAVEVDSPDKGCNQYANWWEILTHDGKLIYRKILSHSHTDEQPFIREGGPVVIHAGTEIIIRAHMHPGGYGGKVFKGSINGVLRQADLPPDFASNVKSKPPFVDYCQW